MYDESVQNIAMERAKHQQDKLKQQEKKGLKPTKRSTKLILL